MSNEYQKLVAIGPVDFQLSLDITQQEMNEYQISFEKINTIKDCKEILEIEALKDRLALTSKNLTINMLLFINRSFKKKTFIEYIVFNEHPFTEEAEFIKEILRYITEQNFLFLIPYNILENQSNNISFTINGPNGQSKSFQCGKLNFHHF